MKRTHSGKSLQYVLSPCLTTRPAGMIRHDWMTLNNKKGNIIKKAGMESSPLLHVEIDTQASETWVVLEELEA